jgi:hypothetical protein
MSLKVIISSFIKPQVLNRTISGVVRNEVIVKFCSEARAPD